MILTRIIAFEKLQQIKDMIAQLHVLLDYPCFKKYCKLIAIDLSKQPKLDADSKALQQINFTGNLDRAEGSTMFLIAEEAKETVLDFLKRKFQVLWFLFRFNISLT